MRKVLLTLDEELIAEVDRASAMLGISRSAFTGEALRTALARLRTESREALHRAGYERLPVEADEVRALEGEQVWPD